MKLLVVLSNVHRSRKVVGRVLFVHNFWSRPRQCAHWSLTCESRRQHVHQDRSCGLDRTVSAAAGIRSPFCPAAIPYRRSSFAPAIFFYSGMAGASSDAGFALILGFHGRSGGGVHQCICWNEIAEFSLGRCRAFCSKSLTDPSVFLH